MSVAPPPGAMNATAASPIEAQRDEHVERLRALHPLPRARLPVLEGPAARMRELALAIGRNVRRRPLTSIAAAIGIGFVLGGAVSFRAGRVALAALARHVSRELLKQVL